MVLTNQMNRLIAIAMNISIDEQVDERVPSDARIEAENILAIARED